MSAPEPSPPPAIATRRAGAEDVDTLLAAVQAGFDSYAAFAEPGWTPPDAFSERQRTADLLALPQTFAVLALDGDRPVGHIAFVPARQRVWLTAVAGLAHLWQLFVLPDHWGRGVAAILHEEAVTEMRARGYTSARLYTPSRHARARRFYERRGWRASGEEWNDALALMLVEYRLDLAHRSPDRAPDPPPDRPVPRKPPARKPAAPPGG